ncbi:hypothetical protein BCR34DRAFT_472425 [Clohesyomyces aquaticus]|uniref:Fungal-specific transcription factor domain-domain-containing protein n=1 Tax=Clohesyomyces aquaticus TaxID=1231657 RepID=A0A1Y2AA41_9PLEO|nr:hypothetical protein BCR34DRAFT_472425 [Clohesyomyces aquaticus]
MDKSMKPNFNFVNLTHPDELKEEQMQLYIRRLAMTEVGRKRRKPRTKRARNEIILEFHSPARRQGTIPDFDRFGGGEVDPFTAYPIDLDKSSRALVANIFRQNGNHCRQLRGSWWPVGLYDAAAFHNVLSNSRLFILMFHAGSYVSEDDSESLFHHTTALQLVNEKLKDPAHHKSDELIGTVCSFMCHEYIIGKYGRFNEHRDALMKIIELKGGIDAITREELRITVSWCDLVGSFPQDIPPKIPLPKKWQNDSRSPPGSPRPFNTISHLWKQQLPMEMSWISIFDDIAHLISLDRAFTPVQFEAAFTVGSWVEPTLVRLLVLRPLEGSKTRIKIIEEVCRLGTLLFLGRVWRWMGASPVRTLAFVSNLLRILNDRTYMVEWRELKPLLLWTLYCAATEATDMVERHQLLFMLAMLMKGMELTTWEKLMEVVRGVLWAKQVFGDCEHDIRDELMSFITEPWTGKDLVSENGA